MKAFVVSFIDGYYPDRLISVHKTQEGAEKRRQQEMQGSADKWNRTAPPTTTYTAANFDDDYGVACWDMED